MRLFQRSISVVLVMAVTGIAPGNRFLPLTSPSQHVEAFSSLTLSPPCFSRSSSSRALLMRRYGMTPRKSNDDENEDSKGGSDDSFNVSEARRQLESLLGDGTYPSLSNTEEDAPCTVASLLAAVSDDHDDDELVDLAPPPAVLTAADRDRRLTEIQLLQKLDSSSEDYGDGDAETAVRQLWDLWYGERGLWAKQRLEETNELMVDPTSWRECDTLLQKMIEEYGVYYTEPVNRLATLYYLQGRLEESYKLCRIILQIKPWHFGALSGIVLVLQQQRKREEARKWAERCIPPSVASTSFPPFVDKDGSPNPLRKEWVKRAVKAAKDALQLAEERATESLGAPEEYYSPSPNTDTSSQNIEEDSAWQ